ncbi:hypothetical protein GCM10029992_14510 [Glycomyces albus]
MLNLDDDDDEFDKVMRRADDLSDGTKTTVDSLDNIVKGLERGPAEGELRTITVQDDGPTSTAIPASQPAFGKGSLTAALAVLSIGGVAVGRKIARGIRRSDG